MEDAKDEKLSSLVSSVNEIKEMMKQKNRAYVILMALQTTDDPETRRELHEKLIQLAQLN